MSHHACLSDSFLGVNNAAEDGTRGQGCQLAHGHVLIAILSHVLAGRRPGGLVIADVGGQQSKQASSCC